ncbi:hypothetical protein [Actinokineospora sp. NPDC004072]
MEPSVHAPVRTELGRQIRERRMTYQEFVEFAERFARENGEVGTLPLRQLQRLAAGRRPDGRPLGPVRPPTARLLERIFGIKIEYLLGPPGASEPNDEGEAELRRLLNASRRVDVTVVSLLREQLDAIRYLDRQLGAVVAHDEVKRRLPKCSTSARSACRRMSVPRSVRCRRSVGRSADAVELLRSMAVDALLGSWLHAALGEACSADGDREGSLDAFDEAAAHLPSCGGRGSGPYVVLDRIHLARWRGHALARLGDTEAVGVLKGALADLDPSFTRAALAMHVDLATAYVANGEREEARKQIDLAAGVATEIGSVRQCRRIESLRGGLGVGAAG